MPDAAAGATQPAEDTQDGTPAATGPSDTSASGDTDLALDATLPGGTPLEVAVGLDPVEALLGDIDLPVTADLGGLLAGGAPAAEGDTDLALDATLPGGTPLEVAVGLDPVEALLGDIDLPVTADLGGLLAGGAPAAESDTDLALDATLPGGTPLEVAVGLDPVEALLGDIDLPVTADLGGLLAGGAPAAESDTDLALDATLPGGTPLEVAVGLDPVEALLGDIDLPVTADLGGVLAGGAPAAEGDTDLALDATLPGGTPLEVAVGLDPVEALLGDIDLPVTADLGGLLAGGAPATGGDTDLALDATLPGGTPLEVAVGLDPVEALLGDIDLPATADLGGVLAGGAPAAEGDTDLALDATLPGGTPLEVAVGLDPVEALLGDIDLPVTADLGGVLAGGAPAAGGDTDLALDATLPGGTPLEVAVGLDPVEALLGDIDLPVTADLGGVLAGGAPATGGDTDLALDATLPGGTPLEVAVGLDPVEALLGDIDLPVTADLGGVLAGGAPAAGGDTDLALDATLPGGTPLEVAVGLDPVEALLGDIDLPVTADLGGVLAGGAPATGGDTDLTLDATLPGGTPLEVAVGLDPVEALLGDIDLPLTADLGGVLAGGAPAAEGDTDLALDADLFGALSSEMMAEFNLAEIAPEAMASLDLFDVASGTSALSADAMLTALTDTPAILAPSQATDLLAIATAPSTGTPSSNVDAINSTQTAVAAKIGGGFLSGAFYGGW
ncbi:hypothetical protein [Teichococcus aestuarii]|uniref:hypothetical protein n=2 Tax=Teichococcus aestuarii TaxID=568898 RepID=UPI003622E0E8